MNAKNRFLETASVEMFLENINGWVGLGASLFAGSFLFSHGSPALLGSWVSLGLVWMALMVGFWRTGSPVLAMIFGLSLGFGPYAVDLIQPMHGNAAWFQGYAAALLCITLVLAVFKGAIRQFCFLNETDGHGSHQFAAAPMPGAARA